MRKQHDENGKHETIEKQHMVTQRHCFCFTKFDRTWPVIKFEHDQCPFDKIC